MIFKKTDPLNRDVILKKDTWEYKILNYYGTNSNGENGNNHPEMENKLNHVISCVERPTYITQNMVEIDTDEILIDESRDNYFKLYIDEKFRFRMTKVVVEFLEENDFGEIVTTHEISGKLKNIKTKGGCKYDSTIK
jgi:predicted FMN-binding regulatory protein PaiB